MERYDGKTRKDDIKKYALIAAGVVVLIILYNVLTFVVHKVSHPTPDILVVFGAATVTDDQEEDDMEAIFKAWASDLDGNGKTVVDVVAYDLRENETMTVVGVEAMTVAGIKEVGAEDGEMTLASSITEGAALIYITHDTSMLDSYFCETYLAELPQELVSEEYDCCVNISGCSMLVEQGLGKVPFYAGVKKDATAEEYDLAVELLWQLKAS